MKVLVIPSWYPTKHNPINGIFFKSQITALSKYGYNVTVLYPEIRTVRSIGIEPLEYGFKITEEHNVKTYRYIGYNPIPGRISYSTALFFYVKLKKLYKLMLKHEAKPDIIHAHASLWGGWAGAKLAQKEDIPFYITEHSSKFTNNLLKRYEKKEVEKAFNIANKVISVGPSLTNELTKYVKKEKIIEIPNIVEIDHFTLKNNEVKKDKFTFLSIAFLTHNKGMDILLRGFAKAFKDENVELVIGGDGEEKENLVKLAKDLQIEKQVRFLGFLNRERTIEEMQNCHAFVLASRSETFGVVYIEALACGKPIIATRCGGPEAIVNSNNGLLVPTEDDISLGNGMKNLKENYYKYIPEKIRKDSIERFSEQAVIKKLTDVYLSR